ncbi:hypothetical protein LguiB_017856 [Lonicera macranthoides]
MFSASLNDPSDLATMSFIASLSIPIPSRAIIFSSFIAISLSLSFGNQNFWHLDDMLMGMSFTAPLISTNTTLESYKEPCCTMLKSSSSPYASASSMIRTLKPGTD